MSDTKKQRMEKPRKATDKVKKRLQERYYDTQQTVTDAVKKNPQKRPLGSQQDEKGVETFEAGSKISSWRLKEWKKQRFQKAEEAEAGSKSKTPKMKQQRKGKDLLLDNTLEAGYLVYEEDEEVDKRLSQSEIAAAVDVTSASKFFELNLNDFGPYNINYTRNGRHLLLGGSRGHVASFDWQTKRLSCEFNAMETVNSVKWLHQETMFAAAQRNGVCFYDNQGIELHMLQNLDCVLRMEFLPYHMLLVTANEKGFLAYTDVSMGTRAAGIKTGLGRLDTMTQNPANAVVCLGHASGTVTLWAPSVKDPLMKMLTHKAPVRSVAVDTTGTYLATSGIDKRLKVFDLRTQKLLTNTHIPMGASSLAFSQRSLLAASMGNRVQIYKDVCREGVVTPYLSHVCGGSVQQVQFCPFEDVLGVGHLKGFTSLIIPGSGDPNVDAMEVNPMATKKQRQHMEVRLLLDKLDPEMISLNNWVTDLAPGSKAPQSTVQQSTTKLGKKQKEEQQREKARSTIKSRPEKKSAYNPKDPLSRFKKAAE